MPPGRWGGGGVYEDDSDDLPLIALSGIARGTPSRTLDPARPDRPDHIDRLLDRVEVTVGGRGGDDDGDDGTRGPDRPVPPRSPLPRSSFLGLLLILVGILVFATIGVEVKRLEEAGVPFLQVSFVRYLVVIAIAAPLIWRSPDLRFVPARAEDRRALLARAVLYYGALNLYYWAFEFIPLGMCTTIGYTFPLYGNFDTILDRLCRDFWALYHPAHAVHRALLGCHAYWMPIGACDPML